MRVLHFCKPVLLTATLSCALLRPVQSDSLDQFGLHKAKPGRPPVPAISSFGFGHFVALAPSRSRGAAAIFPHGGRTVNFDSHGPGDQNPNPRSRPDGSDSQSFPSGHATAAFTVAAMQAHYHPRQSLLWYGGATLIGASRVQLERHYWHDVIAGAALGYFTAQVELHQSKGLILRPFIEGGEASHGKVQVTGVSLNKIF